MYYRECDDCGYKDTSDIPFYYDTYVCDDCLAQNLVEVAEDDIPVFVPDDVKQEVRAHLAKYSHSSHD